MSEEQKACCTSYNQRKLLSLFCQPSIPVQLIAFNRLAMGSWMQDCLLSEPCHKLLCSGVQD